MSVQKAVKICDCGQRVPLTPQASGYEFDYACSCGRMGTISHFHGAKPPTFEIRVVSDYLKTAKAKP